MANVIIDEKYSICRTDDGHRVFDLVVNDQLVRRFPRLEGDFLHMPDADYIMAQGTFLGESMPPAVLVSEYEYEQPSIYDPFYYMIHNIRSDTRDIPVDFYRLISDTETLNTLASNLENDNHRLIFVYINTTDEQSFIDLIKKFHDKFSEEYFFIFINLELVLSGYPNVLSDYYNMYVIGSGLYGVIDAAKSFINNSGNNPEMSNICVIEQGSNSQNIDGTEKLNYLTIYSELLDNLNVVQRYSFAGSDQTSLLNTLEVCINEASIYNTDTILILPDIWVSSITLNPLTLDLEEAGINLLIIKPSQESLSAETDQYFICKYNTENVGSFLYSLFSAFESGSIDDVDGSLRDFTRNFYFYQPSGTGYYEALDSNFQPMSWAEWLITPSPQIL